MTPGLPGLSGEESRRLRQARLPDWTDPMLAVPAHRVFSDPDWLFERKLDGERCLAFRDGARLRLCSRNRCDLGGAYPELVQALLAQRKYRFVADGEVVAFEGGRTSFARLQERLQVQQTPAARPGGLKVYYYLFDLLHLDGYDLTGLALEQRKNLLRSQFSFEGPLRFCEHRRGDGQAFYREACRKGWEGLIAKRARSRYRHGHSRSWLKLKCARKQEFVVGGFTDPQGGRAGLGALLLGYYGKGRLRYAGKVGTGFDRKTLEELAGRLGRIQRRNPPFAEERELPGPGVHWVEPEVVVEVEFTEWTEAGKLRHPRYQGLRADKDPLEVRREQTLER